MKPIPSRPIGPAFVSLLIIMGTAHNGGSIAASQHSTATVTRIYTGSDGLAHSEQIDVKFTPVVVHGQAEMESERLKVASAYFVSLPHGSFADWHPATDHRNLGLGPLLSVPSTSFS